MTSDVRWLDSAEADSWLDLVALARLLPAALDAQLERDADLNFFEYLTLAQLAEAPDRTLRVSQLAAETHATIARLSRVVSRLEGQGLVTRDRDPADGRGRRVRLLEEGLRRLGEAAPGHVGTVREVFADVLSPGEAEAFAATCRRLLTRLDPQQAVLAQTRVGRLGRPGLSTPPG